MTKNKVLGLIDDMTTYSEDFKFDKVIAVNHEFFSDDELSGEKLEPFTLKKTNVIDSIYELFKKTL